MDDFSFSAFETVLRRHARAVETVLDRLLSPALCDGEIARPPRLLAAMRHGVLNGGKRLRPLLVMESAALFDVRQETALPVAASLECVHCYSLVHDDLPAMDDDDLRRGQPTVHKAFDEATAILAGDALLTFAFDVLSGEDSGLSASAQVQLVRLLARAAGLGGMAGGQMLDLAAEHTPQGESEIITLQAMKTGALLRFACEAGAVAANATAEDRARLAEFGTAIGLAFQLADDVLDVTETSDILGKTAGKDIASGKATLVAFHGVDWARRQLDGLIEQANDVLAPFGQKAETLRQSAYFIARRQS
ncbi:MAG: Polyprenyl synthetase [Candidatus Tokpelaia hoelldobleri]|uniref:Probable farnesyl diphosphate synthase n=1 Tax=Candidatus Tokpelaia hoelldobleri TaxID=1902579 RepID=A0A1U9JSJ0_9HYPH|nr:MAG: Polyprenyl synthetase [Candidatus Tokpelaia hoelldoblerii]